MITCSVCGKLANRRKQAIYCSDKCKIELQKKKWSALNERNQTLSSGVVGGMHEMLVCVDLLRRNFFVYRSVTQSAPFDLMAFKDGKYYSVEVTTGNYTASGGFYRPVKDASKFDVLAIVMHDGKIFYEPEWANFSEP